jgi:hypothetical protein
VLTTLSESEWQARAQHHHARVLPWVEPRLERRRRGDSDPVDDFLFSYYSFRPTQLLTWHPGLGVACDGADELLGRRGYVRTPHGVTVDAAAFPERPTTARWVVALLERMRGRPATFGCFGVHEWAMVHGLDPAEIRHASWPLRLAPRQVADVVEALGARCTHFDAFRFFTETARPLNAHQLTRSDQPEVEQRGCLHAGMDLYKWAYKLSPLTSSELVADCFALAREIRTVDMRASPYDLRAMGVEPIAIETTEGRAEYVEQQRQFSERAEPLRDRLLTEARVIQDVSPAYADGSR